MFSTTAISIIKAFQARVFDNGGEPGSKTKILLHSEQFHEVSKGKLIGIEEKLV